MLRHRWIFSILFVFVLLLSACQPIAVPLEEVPEEGVSAISLSSTALDSSLLVKIEAAVDRAMENGQIPGVAIGIVKDGELAYANGFGLADIAGDTPVSSQTLFQIASVSKTLVAVAILQLAEQGLVDLDAPVTEYLPYFTLTEPESRDITIRQLLTHTAGMPDVANWIAEVRNQELRTDEMALEEYIRSLNDESLQILPGESFMYSSIGYDVLGDVIAKASGQSFEEYMRDSVLIPLGMKNSSFLLSEEDQDLLAEPYTYDEDGGVIATGYYPYARKHGPATALWSNVEDLARYANALLMHGEVEGVQVFPASAVDEMWMPYIETGWAEWFGPTWESYGLGWLLGEIDGHLVPNHTGGMDDGYQAHLLLVPDENLAVIALVNIFDREEGSFHAYGIADEAMKVLLGIEAEDAAS